MAVFKLSEGGWDKARRPFKSNYSGTAPSWTDDVLAGIEYQSVYSDSVSASGDPSPRYNVTSGSLPSGISLDNETGAITGTSDTIEAYSFTITASNPLGEVTQSYSGTSGIAPSWTDNTIATIFYNIAYSDGVSATGTPTPTYSVTSGALPTGISLDSNTGALSGTTTDTGAYSFTITATNAVSSITATSSGTLEAPPASIEYLVIAGGGGGGDEPTYGGAGGGAGGYRNSTGTETSGASSATETPMSVVQGTSYTVTVGGGGGTTTNGRGGNGGASVLGAISSVGGGGGGRTSCDSALSGLSGGSGGGGGGGIYGYGCPSGLQGGGSGTANQGRNGGSGGSCAKGAGVGGGGGGASGNGGGGGCGSYGGGGGGLSSSITGTAVTRANGGPGGNGTGGATGTVNEGDGGKGGYVGNSGTVIIRYGSTKADPVIGSGLVYNGPTTSGSYKYIEFTSGSDTIVWN